ncbi:hypothetical protein JK182_12075 [Acetobacter okinawensis]|nr:hypothetical protein [Acetobacter okinawensis]MBS0989394.1 hypothetical protein [Acetobacter okinawensis]
MPSLPYGCAVLLRRLSVPGWGTRISHWVAGEQGLGGFDKPDHMTCA